MKDSYEFTDEEGNGCRVEFEVIHKEGSLRKYGIAGKIITNGEITDTAEANERFITEDEALKTLEMLCEFQVTPCTLCDVI